MTNKPFQKMTLAEMCAFEAQSSVNLGRSVVSTGRIGITSAKLKKAMVQPRRPLARAPRR